MRRFTLAALLGATTLAACTVGPDYHPPETATPAAFAEPQGAPPPGANIDPARWWAVYDDPQLDGLVAAALKDNPNMAIAASRIREARLQGADLRGARLEGADAAGPPRSLHLRSRTSDMVQETSSFPSGCFRAPYLAAFVASSCRISAMPVIEFGDICTSGPISANFSESGCAYGRRISAITRLRGTAHRSPISVSDSPG